VAPEDEANTDYDDMLSHDLDVIMDDNQHKLTNEMSHSPPPLLLRYGSSGDEDFSQLIDEIGQAPHPFTAFHGGKRVSKSIAALFPAADAGPGRAVILVLRGGRGRERLVQYTNISPPPEKVGHNEGKDKRQEGSKVGSSENKGNGRGGAEEACGSGGSISIRISTSSDQGDGESKNGGKATAQSVLVRGKGARAGAGAAAWVKTDKSDVSAHNIAARIMPLLAKDTIAIAAHPRSNSLFFLRGSTWKFKGIHRRNQSVQRINLATLEVTNCLSGLEGVLSLAVHPDGALFVLQTTNGWSQLSEIWRYALTGSRENQQQQQQQQQSSPSPSSPPQVTYEDTGTLVMNELGDSSKFKRP
jgi:hypothetical protein